jgi:hypothetical protein
MAVKEELHRLVQELPDDLSEDERRAFYQSLFMLVLPPRGLAVTDPAGMAEQAHLEIVDDSDDAEAWSRLSAPAFARDWDSAADQVYDRLP